MPGAALRGRLLEALKERVRPARRRLYQWIGRELPYRPQIRRPTLRLGSTYGGWTICPDLIAADSIIYSVGLGDDISFDLAMIERFGVKVHGFDPTPRSVQWLKSQALPQQFVLHEVGLADYDGVAHFSLPPANQVSYEIGASAGGANGVECPVRRLTTIMHDLGHPRLDLLKMDIEGAEHAVIADILNHGVPVRQLLVEFHHRFGDRSTMEPTRATVERLLSAGYRIVDVSPMGYEYAFLKV